MGVWLNTYMHYELAHVAWVWMGLAGAAGGSSMHIYVNIPWVTLEASLGRDIIHVLVALAIGCFMLFKIS